MSAPDIATLLNRPKSTIDRFMHRNHIPMRNLSQANKLAFQNGKFAHNRNQPRGDKSPSWKGGRVNRGDGYIYIYKPEHPRARKNSTANGYVLEHIVVWEEAHNQTLPENYVIHHLNGIRDDNRPENLVALERGEHQHLAEPFKKRIRDLEARIKILGGNGQ